jgi:RNA polymerase sigma factor (sigma-70 family)
MSTEGHSPGVPDGLNRETFPRFAEPHRRELKLHCYRMLGSLQDAEDLIQETFLRAWNALDEFEGRALFKNWLYRIATNACLNALASRSRSRLEFFRRGRTEHRLRRCRHLLSPSVTIPHTLLRRETRRTWAHFRAG